MKQPNVTRETVNLSGELPPCDVFSQNDKGLSRDRNGARFLLVSGLASIREDYAEFATELAGQGFTVYIPNCNDGLEGSKDNDALDQRIEVVQKTIEVIDEPLHATPHSLGGPVTALALGAGTESGLNDLVEYMESINFMQSAGFDDHGPGDILRARRFFAGEAVKRTAKLVPVIMRGGKQSRERFDIPKRAGEIRALWRMDEGYMPSAINDLQEVGVSMKFYVGPKDDLTRADKIRSAVEPIVGVHNVMDIHPEAEHLSMVSHPKHTARVVLDGLGVEYVDFDRQTAA